MVHLSSISVIVNLTMAAFWTHVLWAHPVYQPLKSGTDVNISYQPSPEAPQDVASYSVDLQTSPVQPQGHSLTTTNHANVNALQSPATAVFNTLRSDGTYAFGYKTHDGQSRNENRLPDGTTQGNYAYRTPDGNLVIVNYWAGRHGFVTSTSGNSASHGHGSDSVANSGTSSLFVHSAGSDHRNNTIPDLTESRPNYPFGGFHNFSTLDNNPFANYGGRNPLAVYARNNSIVSSAETQSGNVVSSVVSKSVAATSADGRPSGGIINFMTSVGNNPTFDSNGSNVEGSAPSSSSSSSFDGTSSSRSNTYLSLGLSNSADRKESDVNAVNSDGSVVSSSYDAVKQVPATSGFPTSSPFWVYAGGAPQQQASYRPSYVRYGHWMIPEGSTSQPSVADAYQDGGSDTSKAPSNSALPFGFTYGSNPAVVQKFQQYLY